MVLRLVESNVNLKVEFNQSDQKKKPFFRSKNCFFFAQNKKVHAERKEPERGGGGGYRQQSPLLLPHPAVLPVFNKESACRILLLVTRATVLHLPVRSSLESHEFALYPPADTRYYAFSLPPETFTPLCIESIHTLYGIIHNGCTPRFILVDMFIYSPTPPPPSSLFFDTCTSSFSFPVFQRAKLGIEMMMLKLEFSHFLSIYRNL